MIMLVFQSKSKTHRECLHHKWAAWEAVENCWSSPLWLRSTVRSTVHYWSIYVFVMCIIFHILVLVLCSVYCHWYCTSTIFRKFILYFLHCLCISRIPLQQSWVCRRLFALWLVASPAHNSATVLLPRMLTCFTFLYGTVLLILPSAHLRATA